MAVAMRESVGGFIRQTHVSPSRRAREVALDGRVDLLNTFLERYAKGREGHHKINALDNEGFAALHYAARFNRVVITRKLLETKCNPNVRSKESLTPLHFAARHLPRSTDVNVEQEGASEAKSTSRQLVRLLLQADGGRMGSQDIIVAAQDSQGATPLHMACARGNVPAVQELVAYVQGKHPQLINKKDHHGDTPLHEACLCGNLTIVKVLLDHGADILAQNEDKEHPIHAACKEGYFEIVKEFCRRKHEDTKTLKLAEARDSRFNAPMHLAVESGDLETVKVLLVARANPSVQNKDEVLPIHIAAGHGYLDICRILVENDPGSLNYLDCNLQSPLHYAARANHVHIIKYLISKGCDREVSDNDSASPLLLAAMWDRAEAVRALIIGGCELNVTDKDGKSAVYWAAEEGNMDVLRVLLDHEEGIQLCSVTELYHHNTPLHIAASMGKAQAVKFIISRLVEHQQLQEPSTSEALVVKDGDLPDAVARQRQMTREQQAVEKHSQWMRVERLDFRNDENKTPLHLAAMSGHLDMVQVLVQKYPPALTYVDESGNTPLHLAALHGKTEVVNYLIDKGAEVEARNASLWTPLDQAADKGYADIISLLLEADAPLEAKDKSSLTPLFLACRSGHHAAAVLLLEKGAMVTVQDAKSKLTCLDIAVENGHKKVAMAIVQSDQWETALRHSVNQSTPFRRMIRKMPDVAKEVLDRCMVDNVTHENKNIDIMNTVNYKVEFNYEFLDDYRDVPWRERWRKRIPCCFPNNVPEEENEVIKNDAFSDITSTVDDAVAENATSKHFVATWGPPGFSPITHPLQLMVRYSRTELLKHPVVASLLADKWRIYGRITFTVNLVTYLVYLLFLTLYALLLPHPDHLFCHEFSVSRAVGALPVNGTVCPWDSANQSEALNTDSKVPLSFATNIFLYVAAAVVLLSAGARLAVEVFQLMKRLHHYLLNVENYIEWLTYGFSVVFVSHFGSNCWCPTNWQWQLGAIAVFLAWINLILFLKRVPLLGIYVLMFNTILYTFLKFVVIAFLFVVAFCIAFYMILYKAVIPGTSGLEENVSPFRNAGLSFIKTMVMTIGEFEYDSIFGHNIENRDLLTSFPEVAYILWIIFLIVMPILLTNLLVGLAVDDTKAIQEQAQIQRLSQQINLTLEAEELFPTVLRRLFVTRTKVVYPNRRGLSKRFADAWGADRWDSVDNIRKHTQQELSPIEQVQTQVDQLSKEVKVLMEKSSRIEELMEKSSRIEELMEKSSRIEELLVKMAANRGIHKGDTGEGSEMQ